MRILIATRHRSVVGGVETYLRAVIPVMQKAGAEVALSYAEEANDAEETVDCGCISSWVAALDAVHRWKPDVIYMQESLADRIHSSLFDEYPVVLFAHNYHGTCASGRKVHAFPRYQPCSRQFGPACLLLHYPLRCGGLNPVTALRGYAGQHSQNALLPRYRSILVASEHMQREYIRHGVDESRVHVLHLPPTDVKRDPEPPPERVVTGRLILVGRLTDLKGGKYLLPAVSQAQQRLTCTLSVSLIGAGPDTEELRRLARAIALPIEFVGWLRKEERLTRMREADLLLVPSLWPEPFGLVGIEAACMGVPAVAYDVGGISEWLTPGYTGELAPGNPPTVSGFADAIVRALENPDHHQRLCRGAWESSTRFDLQRHTAALLQHLVQATTS